MAAAEKSDEDLKNTVNDILKEDLFIGEKSLRSSDDGSIENYFENFDFNISSIDFSYLDEDDDTDSSVETEQEEVLESTVDEVDGNPVESLNTTFSLVHKFFQSQKPLSDLEVVEIDSIVEESGIFLIPKDLEVKSTNVNKDFKTLVDSVLK